MTDHVIRHPLRRWRFYWECLIYATGGAWGRSGDVSLIASLALPAWKAFSASSYAAFESYLSLHRLSADILLWKLPLWTGGSILVLRLLAAPFFLYHDKPSVAPANAPDTLRDRTLRLTLDLEQFIAMRCTAKPRDGVHRATHLLYDLDASAKADAAYLAQTARLYSERFLQRVNDLRQDLQIAGIADADLDTANSNPALLDNIRIISGRLREAARQLPGNAAPEVIALHQANTRLQNTIADQQDKIVALERAATKRDITPEQRAQIALRLASMPIDVNTRRWRVNVVPLTNASDSNHFSRAIVAALETFSDAQIGGPDGMALKHLFSDEDTAGIVLLAGKSLYTQALGEQHEKHQQLIIDAFAAAGIEIKRGACEYLIRETTLLVGRRP